jgi:hypothetical protein
MDNRAPAQLDERTVDRAVLIWKPDGDESEVKQSVAEAAAFLGVTEQAVIAAIEKGDLVNGSFVDWQVGGT